MPLVKLKSLADFELSNVANGQKIEELLSLNKAQENLWAIYGPIAVKLLRSRAVAKENHSIFCKTVLIFGIGKGFLTNLLFTS